MCVARLTVQRYDIFGAGANFPAQKQGCFQNIRSFFVACLCGLFFGPGTAEQGTDNSGTEMKVPDNSETVEQITAEQEKICRNSGTVEQITVEQKLNCRKNPLRILYNIY